MKKRIFSLILILCLTMFTACQTNSQETENTQNQTDTSDSSTSDYFTTARLNRQQARDSAVSLVLDIGRSGTDDIIQTMVDYTVAEAQIEILIMAKRYADCVAFIGEDSLSLSVATPESGLTETDTAKIVDVVRQVTDFTEDQISIIEVASVFGLRENNDLSYFASARLNRQQARDNALLLFQNAAAREDADNAVKNLLDDNIQTMANYTVTEAEIENLVVSKGYADCVAFIGGDTMFVAVAASEGGLTEADTTKIKDVIKQSAGFTVDQITIIEVD